MKQIGSNDTAIEETNVSLYLKTTTGNLRTAQIGQKSSKQQSLAMMHFNGTLSASSEVESFEWITYKDRDRTSAVDMLILDKLKEQNLIQ